MEKLNEEERRVRAEREKTALLDQLEELKQAILAERHVNAAVYPAHNWPQLHAADEEFCMHSSCI